MKLTPILVLSLSLGLAGCKSAEPFELRGVSSTAAVESARSLFLAGVGTADMTPENRYPLGGYGGGARREEWPFLFGVGLWGQFALECHQRWHEGEPGLQADMLAGSRGIHDRLTARAIVLRPEQVPGAPEAPPFALVRIDAIGTTAEIHARAAEGVAHLGYRPETILIAATHTHSGPAAFMRAPMARLVAMDNFRLEVEARIVDAVISAIKTAHATARPASIGFSQARDREGEHTIIARNRRSRRFLPRGTIPTDAIDDVIDLVHLKTRDGKEPIATLINYAVHPTVLGSDNLHFSADLSGGIERALSRKTGAPAVFFNGAEGDVAPRRVKAPGGLERINELGERLTGIVTPALKGVTLHPRIRLTGALGVKELGGARAVMAAGRERFLDADASWARWLTEPLTLPLNLVLWTLGIHNVRFALTWNFAAAIVVDLDGYADRSSFLVGGLRLQAGSEEVAFLGLPGEGTHDVGLALKAIARKAGVTRPLVIGLAQDHVGYIASRTEYRRGGYEAWSTLFGEHTADELLEAERGILKALGYAPE